MLTFLIFLSAHTLSIFFRSALAVVAPEVAADTGATLADLGRASAAWFFVFALAQLPVGWALDRFGPRRTLGYLFLGAAIGAFGFAIAREPWHLVASMALVGGGCSAALMGAIYTFGRTLPPAVFARRTSWLLGFSTIGGLLAATPLSSAVQGFGWRSTFAAVGVLTLLSAVMVLRHIVDPPRVAAPGLAAPGLAATGGANPASGPSDSLVAGLRAVLGIRALWPILPIIAVSYAVVAAERGLWSGPYFATVHELGAIARGNAVLPMAIAMAVGAFAFGELDRITGKRKILVLIGSTLTALAFLALGAMPNISTYGAVALLAVIGGAGFTYGMLLAHGRSFLPDHLLGRGLTLLNFGFIAGAGLVQLLSGEAVATMQRAQVAPAQLFANLHMAFGCALLVVTVIYLAAREKSP